MTVTPTPVNTKVNTFEIVARWLIGGVLLFAGMSKALGPAAEFAANIEAYRMLPSAFPTPLSLILPWIEIWVGLFLITGFHTLAAARAALGLFTVFIFALGSAILRKLDLNTCGCFGADSFSPQQTIMGDIVLWGLCLVLSLKRVVRPWLSLDHWLGRS